ncbi:hypothetical protein ZTR_02613 [Talaromyces verruculosus]|nr:hypothetical protein ZTR_02613 [Talaromyces verruculosus]
MHALTSFKWLSLVFPAVHAQGFTFPTQQITFLVGDLVNITWDVPQHDSASTRYALPQSHYNVPPPTNVSNAHSYIWNATRDHYRESGCVFELEPLYGDGSWQAPNFTSPFFAVDMRFAGDPGPTDWNFNGSSVATTAMMATAMTTPTPTPSSGTVSTATVTAVTSGASASTTASASSQSGLTSAQKTGIGVGISLGVLLACLLCFLLIRYRHRQTNNNEDATGQHDPIPKTDIKPPATSTNHHASGTGTLFSELSAQNYDEDGNKKESAQIPISELMASPPRAEFE